MACELTTGRTLDCKDIIGGVRAVYFCQLADAALVTSNGAVTDLDITGSGGGDKLFKYNLVRGTGSMTETITASADNGTVFYEPSVNIKLHKLTIADRNEIKLLAQNRLLIFVETNAVDANGKRQIWCLGSENGMELTTATANSGVAFGDMNGYDLTFVGMESNPKLFVNAYDNVPFDNSAFTVTVTE